MEVERKLGVKSRNEGGGGVHGISIQAAAALIEIGTTARPLDEKRVNTGRKAACL